jgi:hypothetical protein
MQVRYIELDDNGGETAAKTTGVVEKSVLL